MSLGDRIKEAARGAKDRVSPAGEGARARASNAEVDREALRRARARARAAARRAGQAGPRGESTPELQSESESRTKAVFARAQRYATAGAPVDVDMDPSPSGDDMWRFAEAGRGGQPTAYDGGRGDTEGDAPGRWQDTREDGDGPGEVSEDLRADGLDPMRAAGQADYGVDGDVLREVAGHDLEDYSVDQDDPLAFEDPFGAGSGSSGSESGGDWGWR